MIIKNIILWLRAHLRELTKPTQFDMEVMRKLARLEGHAEGYIEGYQARLEEEQAARSVDLALVHVEEEPYHPGTMLHAYNKKHNASYRPVSLVPTVELGHFPVELEQFPWLQDDSWLNGGGTSAFDQLLDQKTEKREVVKRKIG